MTVTVYRSTDSGAPSLTGQVGTLISVLDWCLWSGSASPAGWTKPFTGTNTAIFRTGGSVTRDLWVDDSGNAVTAAAREARVRGYVSTTAAADAGTEPFPMTYQKSTGVNIRKSNTADATARPWVVIATNQTVYVFILSGDYGTAGFAPFYFGRYTTLVPTTDHNWMIVGMTENSTGTVSNFVSSGTAQTFTASTNHYLQRSYTEIVGSSVFGKMTFGGNSSTMGSYMAFFPNTSNGKTYIAPIIIAETHSGFELQSATSQSTTATGYFSGLWNHWFGTGLVSGDQIVGTTESISSMSTTGKTFEWFQINLTVGVGVLVEISNTW